MAEGRWLFSIPVGMVLETAAMTFSFGYQEEFLRVASTRNGSPQRREHGLSCHHTVSWFSPQFC